GAAHSARGARDFAAIRTIAPPRRSRPPPRATGRTVSFVPGPPPRFVVLVFVETSSRVARPALRLVHDAPTLRALRRIVRPAHLPVHDNTTPGGRGRPLRDAKRSITLRRRLIGGSRNPSRLPSPRVPGPKRREELPTHDQEAFGTPQNVHPHPLRTGPRRAVLSHPALRRAGSDARAPARMVRRHDVVPRRALRCVGRAAAGGVARAGGALLPTRCGTERTRGRERLRVAGALFTAATRPGSAGTADPMRAAHRR